MQNESINRRQTFDESLKLDNFILDSHRIVNVNKFGVEVVSH